MQISVLRFLAVSALFLSAEVAVQVPSGSNEAIAPH